MRQISPGETSPGVTFPGETFPWETFPAEHFPGERGNAPPFSCVGRADGYPGTPCGPVEVLDGEVDSLLSPETCTFNW